MQINNDGGLNLDEKYIIRAITSLEVFLAKIGGTLFLSIFIYSFHINNGQVRVPILQFICSFHLMRDEN